MIGSITQLNSDYSLTSIDSTQGYVYLNYGEFIEEWHFLDIKNPFLVKKLMTMNPPFTNTYVDDYFFYALSNSNKILNVY
jgi:hypothetical protein